MANNSYGRRVYVEKIASTIFIAYIVDTLSVPRYTSGAHPKWSWVSLCHSQQSMALFDEIYGVQGKNFRCAGVHQQFLVCTDKFFA